MVHVYRYVYVDGVCGYEYGDRPMMVNQATCDNCDYQIDYLGHDPDRKPLCPKCHEPLQFSGKLGCVFGSANDMRHAARELVEEWRSSADNTHGIPKWMLRNCASDLEGILEDHGVLVDG